MSKLANFCLAQGLTSLATYLCPNVSRVPPPLPWERRLQESTLLSGNGKVGALPYAQGTYLMG